MNIRQGTKDITIGGQKIRAIIEYEFNDYVLYVFPGKLSQFDILIKYKKDGSRIRTPKHIHWAVDMLINFPNLTDAFHPQHMGKGAIVRRYNIAAGIGSGNNTLAVRANAGIHNRHKHSILRPVFQSLNQPVAGLPDVIGGNVMG